MSTNDKIKIRLSVETGFANCKHVDHEEVDRAEWEAMTEKQREEYLNQAAMDYLFNCVESSAWVVEEGDEE